MCYCLRKDMFILVKTNSVAIGVLTEGSESAISIWTQVYSFDLDQDPQSEEIISEIERLRTIQLELSEPVVVDIGLSLPQREEADHHRGRDATKFSLLAQRRWRCENDKKEVGRDFYLRMQGCKQKGSSNTRSDVAVQCHNADASGLLCSWIEDVLPPVSAAVIVNSIINVHRERPTYTPDMLDIAMLIYLTSAKTYRLMKQILRWPSVSCLYEHYSGLILTTKTQITEMEMIMESLNEVKSSIDALRSTGVKVETQFTLAIDAFAFRTFSGSTMSGSPIQKANKDGDTQLCGESASVEKEEQLETRLYNNGFIILLIPHDYRVPTKLIHLAVATSGAYSKEINEKVSTIMKAANGLGLRVWFRATDGDPGVSDSHNQFYKEHVMKQTKDYFSLITSIWTWLCADVQAFVPISDPLHIWKNVRARFICHKIVLFRGSQPTNIDETRRILKIGNVLDDDSQIGKMRDQYVTALFTFDNVCKLLRNEEYTSACLLLPFACWLAATYSRRIDRGFRMFLLELSFHILLAFYGEFPELKKVGITQNGHRQKAPTLFSRSHYVKRMLNTLCAVGLTLGFGSDSLRMDSLGTHMVENVIGLARTTSSDPRYDRIISTYAHNEIRRRLAAKLGLVLRVQGRINHGGCKIDLDAIMNEGSLVTKPRKWSVPYVMNLVRALCCPDVAPAMKTQAEKFANEIDAISVISESQSRDSLPNATANSQIMARLLSFKTEDGCV